MRSARAGPDSIEAGPAVAAAWPVLLVNNSAVRSALYQAVALILVLWFAYELFANARDNLLAQRVATGFGFLNNTAGFAISQTLIAYDESHTYARAFLVGLLNTLLVSALGIVFATVLGFIIGIARLSSNWLVSKLAGAYVEITRNLPLLFQILFWYLAVLGALPPPRQSIAIGLQPALVAVAGWSDWIAHFGFPIAFGPSLRELAASIGPPDIYLNNRGIIVPRPVGGEGASLVLAAFILAIALSIALGIWSRWRHSRTGRSLPLVRICLGLIVGLPALALFATGSPVSLEHPELRGFNFVGGLRVLPEFAALLIALSTYTAAFIAEIVRAGILAVSRGQAEAAYSLGLRRGLALRLVIVPQAMRLIVPPLTSQYLNLTKNSSLAVAVGYPDLVAVFAGTALNQTGQAIEIIAITMAVYLLISLVTSAFMNWYNARIALVER